MVRTGVRRGPGAKAFYRTPRVHREYGGGEGTRRDLAVLHEDHLSEADRELKANGEYIEPMFGVELGAEKSQDIEGHIKGDVDKLARCWGRGYLLHFYRDVTKADKGTKSWRETQAKIGRIFMDPARRVRLPENIKALFFIIELGKARKDIRGNCRLYYPGAGGWRRINLQKVESAVKEALRGTNPA